MNPDLTAALAAHRHADALADAELRRLARQTRRTTSGRRPKRAGRWRFTGVLGWVARIDAGATEPRPPAVGVAPVDG